MRAHTIIPKRRDPTPGLRRELIVLSLLLLLVGAGSFVALGPDGPAPTGLDTGTLFSERASFCPGLPDGTSGVSDIAMGSRRGGDMGILVEPLDARAQQVAAGEILLRRVDSAYPHDVVGFGDLVGATTYVSFDAPITGYAAAQCSARASSEWYFPQGSSADGFNQRLVVYNPFPGDAVVSVTFFTPDGPRTRAALSDIAVPSGRSTTIAVNRFILQQPVLATQISATRGRVAAWKALFARPPAAVQGASFTAGAASTATDWYFAAGRVAADSRQSISLLNPTDEEAVVTVSLITEGEPLQAADLVEMPLPRRSVMEIPLRRALQGEEPGDVSAIATSVNEVPIVAERSLMRRSGETMGLTTQIGAQVTASAWWLGPPAAEPDQEWVAVLNASEDQTAVTLTLASPEGAASWTGEIDLPPGGRSRLKLPGKVRGGVLLLDADGAVVAERIARVGPHISGLLGLPVPGRT